MSYLYLKASNKRISIKKQSQNMNSIQTIQIRKDNTVHDQCKSKNLSINKQNSQQKVIFPKVIKTRNQFSIADREHLFQQKKKNMKNRRRKLTQIQKNSTILYQAPQKAMQDLQDRLFSIQRAYVVEKKIDQKYPQLRHLASQRETFYNCQPIQQPNYPLYYPNNNLFSPMNFQNPYQQMMQIGNQNFIPKHNLIHHRYNSCLHNNQNQQKNLQNSNNGNFFESLHTRNLSKPEISQNKKTFSKVQNKLKTVDIYSQKQQKTKLIDKFRKVVYAVIFTIRLPKYAQIIRYHRFISFKQKNQKTLMDQSENVLINLFKKIKFYQLYSQAQIEQKKKRGKLPQRQMKLKIQKNKIHIVKNDLQFFMDIDICNTFIKSVFLKIIDLVQQSQFFKSVVPVIKHFMNCQFPFHYMFQEEELEMMEYHSKSGQISSFLNKEEGRNKKFSQFSYVNICKQLIINYLLIKMLVFKLFMVNKHTAFLLKKELDKDQDTKKKIILIGKKIKINILIIYAIVNQRFQDILQKYYKTKQNRKSTFTIAYQSLENKIKSVFHGQIVVSAKFIQRKQQKKNKKQLLKGIVGIDYLRQKFSNKLKSNYDILANLQQTIYKMLKKFRSQETNKIKKKIIKDSLNLKNYKNINKFQFPQPPTYEEEFDEQSND